MMKWRRTNENEMCSIQSEKRAAEEKSKKKKILIEAASLKLPYNPKPHSNEKKKII